MKILSAQELGKLRFDYPAGTIVKLLKMDDPQAPPIGTQGVVQFVDDAGQIHINWENGSSLAVVPDVDEVEIIYEEYEVTVRAKIKSSLNDDSLLNFLDNNISEIFFPDVDIEEYEMEVEKDYSIKKEEPMKFIGLTLYTGERILINLNHITDITKGPYGSNLYYSLPHYDEIEEDWYEVMETPEEIKEIISNTKESNSEIYVDPENTCDRDIDLREVTDIRPGEYGVDIYFNRWDFTNEMQERFQIAYSFEEIKKLING